MCARIFAACAATRRAKARTCRRVTNRLAASIGNGRNRVAQHRALVVHSVSSLIDIDRKTTRLPVAGLSLLWTFDFRLFRLSTRLSTIRLQHVTAPSAFASSLASTGTTCSPRASDAPPCAGTPTKRLHDRAGVARWRPRSAGSTSTSSKSRNTPRRPTPGSPAAPVVDPRHGRLEMQAPADRDLADAVPTDQNRRVCSTAPRWCVTTGRRNPPARHQHVAAVDGRRRFDESQVAVAAERGDGRHLGAAGHGAGPRDDRQGSKTPRCLRRTRRRACRPRGQPLDREPASRAPPRTTRAAPRASRHRSGRSRCVSSHAASAELTSRVIAMRTRT